MDLELLKKLSDLEYFQKVLLGASNRTSSWKRVLFHDNLTRLVASVKVDYKDRLEAVLPLSSSFWELFLDGRVYSLFSLSPSLDFTTSGRVTASLGLLVYILDKCDEKDCPYSKQFLLEVIAIAGWNQVKLEYKLQKARLLQTQLAEITPQIMLPQLFLPERRQVRQPPEPQEVTESESSSSSEVEVEIETPDSDDSVVFAEGLSELD